MELEFIQDKVYYKIFDKTYKASTGAYSKHKATNVAKLAEIQQNIDNIKSEYRFDELVILKQVHGDQIIDADETDLNETLEADALVTTRKNIALSILTADCVPVLFTSSDGSVIGAAHCGWKSAKANIIKKLVAKMREKNAHNILAIIGPSIQQKSYEVDENYYQNFTSDDPACKDFFIKSKKDGHYMFDLSGYVARKIEQENIKIFIHSKDDTCALPEKYPSYRRATLNPNEPYNSNILSTIIIR
jgi:hypothetical protein